MRMPVPSLAVVVSPVDAGLTKNQCVAHQIFTEVGINLDEAVGGDKQAQLDRVCSSIQRDDFANEGKLMSIIIDAPFEGFRRQRRCSNFRSTSRSVLMPSTAWSHSWWSLSTAKE